MPVEPGDTNLDAAFELARLPGDVLVAPPDAEVSAAAPGPFPAFFPDELEAGPAGANAGAVAAFSIRRLRISCRPSRFL